MGLRDFVRSWPVIQQVMGEDLLALGRGARSARQASLKPRTAQAGSVTKSICPYCAVGCGQRVYAKDGEVTQIEGDPDSPISRGRLCPKGASSRSYVQSPLREYGVKYRRPHSTQWEDLDLEEAMDMIADRVIKTRDETWEDEDDEGRHLHRTLGSRDPLLRLLDLAVRRGGRKRLVRAARAGGRYLGRAGVAGCCGRSALARHATRDRRYPAAPQVRLPAPQEALPPLHPGGRGRDLRHQPGALRAGLRGGVRQLGEGEDDRVRLRGGWTQHTHGVQNIRAASIIQLLLGNMGRPGGGILALRGYASIQGSTDIPTLFNILPGYIPMPHAHEEQDLDTFIERNASPTGYWGNMRSYMVSLLKAYWGEAATAENDYCFDHLPRLTGDHSFYRSVMGMVDGWCKGFFVMGQNPAVGAANGKLQRLALANLDWLVVRDLIETETASFWYDGPEVETGELKSEDIGTEVFFLPAASHVEKEGSFTNTQRLLQWRNKAVEPKSDCRSELWFMYHLGRKAREKLSGSGLPRDRAVVDPRGRRRSGGASSRPASSRPATPSTPF